MRIGRYIAGRSANKHIEFTWPRGRLRIGFFENPAPTWWHWKRWPEKGWQLRVGRFAIARSLTALILMALLAGCASTPNYRTARPTCLQWANAACIAAMRNGSDSGVAIIWKADAKVMHAVIWVQRPDEARPRWYDPMHGCYIRAPKNPIWGPTRGPTLAWFGEDTNTVINKETP